MKADVFLYAFILLLGTAVFNVYQLTYLAFLLMVHVALGDSALLSCAVLGFGFTVYLFSVFGAYLYR